MSNLFNEDLKSVIATLDEEKIAELWVDYCNENDVPMYVYDNDEEFINTHFKSEPYNAICAAFNGNYNPYHNYVTFNGYGNLVSSDYVSDLVNPDTDDEEFQKYIVEQISL